MGYGRCIRKDDCLNIGLGREDNSRPSEHVSAFLDLLVRRERLPPDLPSRLHGHAYLLYPNTRRPLLDDGALPVGDAAGLAYPQSGEGIRPAVESGLLAPEAIAEADGDYRRARLDGYAERLTTRLGKRNASDLAHRPMPPFLRRAIAAGLLATRRLTRHILPDRWFFHSRQPALSLSRPIPKRRNSGSPSRNTFSRGKLDWSRTDLGRFTSS